MAHLLKLELKKIHPGHYICIVLVAIIFGMFFIAVSLHDSSGRARSFSEAFRTVEMIFAFVFVIFFSVLNAQIIIGEYNNKTILILFTYPVDRRKVICAKLIMITGFVTVSMLAGYLACGGFIVVMDARYDWIAGTFGLSTLYEWTGRAVASTIVFCILGLGTFVAGMWRKSVPVTIVSSVILIYLRQIVVASTENYQESAWVILTDIVIAVIGISYVFQKKITQLD